MSKANRPYEMKMKEHSNSHSLLKNFLFYQVKQMRHIKNVVLNLNNQINCNMTTLDAHELYAFKTLIYGLCKEFQSKYLKKQIY